MKKIIVSLAALTLSVASIQADYIALGANYTCVPANELPPVAYRIYTDSDILYMYGFNFDPVSLGTSEKGYTRCWFKITKSQRDAANQLFNGIATGQKVTAVLPELEARAADPQASQDTKDALLIIKKVLELSNNQPFVWTFTSYLLYKRP